MNTCLLTGSNPTDYNNKVSDPYIYYTLTWNNNQVEIYICKICWEKIKNNLPEHYVVKGLISNGKWPRSSMICALDCTIDAFNCADIPKFFIPGSLLSYHYPKVAADKLNNLLQKLFEIQTEDGQVLKIDINDENLFIRLYFRSTNEFEFYLQALAKKNYINYSSLNHRHKEIKITVEGLVHVSNLNELGNQSKYGFVAMAFKPETKLTRDAIHRAISQTSYEPYIVDEKDLKSDQTIPDAIFTGIKNSKFCIADFSYHRRNVYFEAGFAVGLGKPVIYLCNKTEFENPDIAFDIKQLQHIIYENEDQLENELRNKIKAWIE